MLIEGHEEKSKQSRHYSWKEIDFEEFYNLILKLRREEEERLALLHIFQILDKNDDGRLTVDEIIYVDHKEEKTTFFKIIRF